MLKRCPQCGKPFQASAQDEFRPFCSERCKLIDLGDWLTEKNSLPGDDIHAQELDMESSEFKH